MGIGLRRIGFRRSVDLEEGFSFFELPLLVCWKRKKLGSGNGNGKCEEVCLVVRIGSLGAKKIEKEGNCVVVF